MRKAAWKERLKKLMFIQHICIGALVCLGIGFIVTKTLARENSTNWDNSQYINDNFWNQSPTNSDLFDAIYSGNTAYTRNMSGYNNTCNKNNTNYILYTGDTNQITILPEIITGNTIYILSGGKYVTYTSQITLSGNCISIIGKGNATFAGTINTTQSKYSVIDAVSYQNNGVSTLEYTVSTGIIINFFSNNNVNYSVTGDILGGEITGAMQSQLNKTVTLTKENSDNILDISLYDDSNHLNHIKKTITHDTIAPTITGITFGTNTQISNLGLYNTGVTINVYDINLSGTNNNGNSLSGTNFSFPNQGLYTIKAVDKAGNQTTMSFEIDTTAPTLNTLIPTNGGIVPGTILTLSRTTQENTTKIKTQTYYLYSGSTIISSGNVQPGITSKPLPNINNGTYKREIVIEDTAGNIATGTVAQFIFSKIPSIFSTTNGYYFNNQWYVNTNPELILSGNKNFNYTIYSSGVFYKTGIYSGITKKEDITRIGGQTGTLNVQFTYDTEDGDNGTGNFVFVIDKATPTLSLLPLGKRINNTSPINYTRYTTNKFDSMIKFYNFLINDTIVYSGTNKGYQLGGLGINRTYKAQVFAYDIAGNIGNSSAETTIVDITPPQIHNVINGGAYNNIPYPIIRDENNDPIQVTLQKNGTIIQSGMQSSPYTIQLVGGEATYAISTTDTAGNSTGITFTIDTTAPTINLSTPSSGTSFTNTNSINLTWSGFDTNLSGFDVKLESRSQGYFNTGIQTKNNYFTVNNLNNGIYTREVTATDKAGNKTTSSKSNFTIAVPLTGQIGFSGTILVGYTYYTKAGVQLFTNINKTTVATITGDIIGDNGYLGYMNRNIGAGNQRTPLQLTAGDGKKDISVTLQNYTDNEKIMSFLNVVVDTNGPSKPVLTNLNNQQFTGSFILTWPNSTDTGAGVKEYTYVINQGTQSIKTGSSLSPSVAIENMQLGLQGTYSFKVQATDYLGNSSDRSEPVIFSYTGIPDTSPDAFTFSRQYDVKRNKIYKSNTITITGLSPYTSVKASIDEGKLFVNGTDVNKQALVKNQDNIYIELESSDEYSESTISTLSINDKISIFKLITEKKGGTSSNNDDEDLSDDEIQELEDTYDIIKNLDNNLKMSFKQLLEDKIDQLEEDDESETEIDKLRYIYDRLVDDMETASEDIYTAPNGKTYIITYKKGVGYTSINFVNKNKYFATTNEIKTFIDKNNPKNIALNYKIDKSRSTAAYKAPNGKIYTLFKTTNGQYGSYNFVIQKLFNSVQEVKNHIYKNNPKK